MVEELYTDFYDQLLGWCTARVRSPAAAEDLVQETFLKLLTSGRRFDSQDHERAWLIVTASNACKDILKNPWRQRTRPLEDGFQVPAPEAEDGSVLSAVNTLPPHYRAVIYLCYYEGYTAAEIGEILGVPTATVHTRLARGRARLKEILGGTDYEQSV